MKRFAILFCLLFSPICFANAEEPQTTATFSEYFHPDGSVDPNAPFMKTDPSDRYLKFFPNSRWEATVTSHTVIREVRLHWGELESLLVGDPRIESDKPQEDVPQNKPVPVIDLSFIKVHAPNLEIHNALNRSVTAYHIDTYSETQSGLRIFYLIRLEDYNEIKKRKSTDEIREGEFALYSLVLPPKGNFFVFKHCDDESPEASYELIDQTGRSIFQQQQMCQVRINYLPTSGFTLISNNVPTGNNDNVFQMIVVDPEGRINSQILHPKSGEIVRIAPDMESVYIQFADHFSCYEFKSGKMEKKWDVSYAGLFEDHGPNELPFALEENTRFEVKQIYFSPESTKVFMRLDALSPSDSTLRQRTLTLIKDAATGITERKWLILDNTNEWLAMQEMRFSQRMRGRVIPPRSMLAPIGASANPATGPTSRATPTTSSRTRTMMSQADPVMRVRANDQIFYFNTRTFDGFLSEDVFVYHDINYLGYPLIEDGNFYLKFADVHSGDVVYRYPLQTADARHYVRVDVRKKHVVINYEPVKRGANPVSAEVLIVNLKKNIPAPERGEAYDSDWTSGTKAAKASPAKTGSATEFTVIVDNNQFPNLIEAKIAKTYSSSQPITIGLQFSEACEIVKTTRLELNGKLYQPNRVKTPKSGDESYWEITYPAVRMQGKAHLDLHARDLADNPVRVKHPVELTVKD